MFRRWLRHDGKGEKPPLPLQFALLELTQGDPLKAQQIESEVTEEWWTYHQSWIEERNRYAARKRSTSSE